MKWQIVFLGLFLFLFSFVFAEDAQPDPLLLQQTSLSSAVRSALQNSKQAMSDLENYYGSMMSSLEAQHNSMTNSLETQLNERSAELTTLSMHLTNTMNSLKNLSAELDNLNLQLEKERERVRTRNKILLWLGIIGAVITLGKVAAFIFYAQRIPIPRWLDIIL